MIIPVYRVITSQYPILASTTIEPGMVVTLNSSTGYAEKCGATGFPVGLAADKNRAATAFEWVNRVTDMGVETGASGMLSVYHGGGEFYIDVDDSSITNPAGTAVTGVLANGLNLTYGKLLYAGASGQLTTVDGNSGASKVAAVLETAETLSSGIPGEYAPDSYNMTDDNVPREWIKIKLLI